MSSIIQQPAALSFTGNMLPVIVTSSTAVAFTLKKGEDTLIEQVFMPGDDSRVEVDLSNVIASALIYTINESAASYNNTTIYGTFTVTVDGTSFSFVAIRGGVRRLATSVSSFVAENFLTWQPQDKKVRLNSPEYLTAYLLTTQRVKLKATFPNLTTTTLTLATGVAGAWTFNLTYAKVTALLSGVYPAFYDVWIETAATSVRTSFIQRYTYSESKSAHEHWFLFQNSLGGLDTLLATGVHSFVGDNDYTIGENDETLSEVAFTAQRLYTKNTGPLDTFERQWLLDFFPSAGKYMCDGSTLLPIVMTESDVNYSAIDLPSSYQFTYRLADDKPLLNLPRVATLPAGLSIVIPSGESFQIPPRLSELPRLEVGEGVMLPALGAYTDQYGMVTVGALLSWLSAQLGSSSTAGGGGVGHTHNNFDLLQLLTMIDGYLKHNGAKINAGISDDFAASGPAAAKILRKDIPDTAAEKITFKKGIQLGENFIPGVAGTGGAIDGAGNGELKSLKIYESLEVPELRYNRIEINVGDRWNSPGGGIIKSVVPDVLNGVVQMTGTITLKLEAGEIGLIAEQDKCMGIFHYEGDGAESINAPVDLDDSKGNRTVKGFFTSYFRVTEIIGANNSAFRYALRPDYVTQHHPMAEMHFVAYSNADDITRQTSSYETRTYIRHLCRMTEWEISKDNIAAQHGDLSNLSVHGLTMTGYSAYLNNIYMNGTIQQILDAPVLMEIDSSKGDFLAPGETTTITLKIRKGFDELTSTMKQWRWTRDTADPAADLVWKNNHSAYTDTGELSYEDLGNNAFNTTSTVFSFWCSDEVGTVVNGSLTI